ncbi:TraB/VirB10 family protein [Neisseria sicca]|uniref:TraB/VirB10 family protein n=1 Tax=Neisseria sicca TaxID=490 RepID=UPI0028EAEC65|nr:TraB/VirB10 family protein [Neisseria sicca]
MGLKETWRNGSGKQKRNMVLGGVAAFLTLATIAAMITDSVRGTRSGRRKTEVEQVVTPNQRNLTQEGLAAEIYALRNQVQQMQQQMVQRQPEKGGGLTEEQVRQIVAENRNAGLESQAASAIGNGFVPPGTLPDDKGAPLAPGAGGSAQPAASAEEEDSSPYQNHTSNSSKNSGSKDKDGSPAVGKESGAANDTRSYLPAGSQLSVIAVSGINAPTGDGNGEAGSSGENAMPILLRVKGLGRMANGFKSDLSDCVIIANAYGQLADERAYVRTKSITCIRSDGKAVEATLKGTLIGEDGKPGWHGRLVSRDGKAIAQMVKIGMINTAGQIGIAAAGSGRIGHRDGGGNSINIGTGGTPLGQAATTAAANGLNDIFGRVASIYEKYAQQSFPVIEIQPLRTGDILIQSGISLEYAKDKR